MRIRKLTWSLLITAAAAAAAPPPTPEEVARTVQEAHRAQNVADLRKLASRDIPDPWLVADVLCAGEHFDVAVEFVLAAPRLDTARLSKAIEASRESPPSADDRAHLAAAFAALEEQDAKTAVGHLEAIETDGKSIFGARVLAARAATTDSALAHRAAANAARYLGWLRLAAESEGRASILFENEGRLADAVAASRKRLEVETSRGRTARLADALCAAGRLSLLAAELPEAEDQLRRALRQAERQSNADLKAKAERYLGMTLAARGGAQDARIYLLRAFEDYSAREDRVAMLATLEPIIALDRKLDGIPSGMTRAEQVLELAAKLKDDGARGRILSAMGSMEEERNAWKAAVTRFDAAHAAFRSADAVAAAGEAAFRSGALALRMGQRDAARRSLLLARAEAKSVGAPALQARVEAALGDLALELGDKSNAQTHFEAAAKLAEATEDTALSARSLSRLGRLQLRMGDAKSARQHLTDALVQLRKIRDTDYEVRTLLALGEAERHLGQRERAQQLADEVADLARKHQLPGMLARAAALRTQAGFGATTTREQASAAFETLRKAARESLSLLESSGLTTNPRYERDLDHLLRVGVDAALAAQDVTLLLTVCEFRRGRVTLAALGGRRALMRSLTPEKLLRARESSEKRERKLLEDYERARERMDKNAMLAARERIKKLRAELARIENDVEAQLAPAKSLFAPGVTPLADIQSALTGSESLLYFCAGVEETGVVVVTRANTRTIHLGKHSEIREVADGVLRALDTPDPDAAIQQARQLIYMPLSIAESQRDLVIAPVAPLDRIPFCLFDKSTTVRYCDSAASLVHAARLAQERGTGVVGIGNTSFASPEIRIRLVHLSNGIPVRRLETGRKLSEMFSDVVLVGPPATESAVRDAIQARDRWQAIHLAAPLLLDLRQPYASMIGLTPANGDDGVIDLYDLMRLGLPSELTMFAAGEPAKGPGEVGAAIRALARGVQLSGSARVVVSQWWMDNKAATTMMSNFYRYWQDRETPAPLALRRAQAKVTELHGWAHPKYWAGWQLWGAR